MALGLMRAGMPGLLAAWLGFTLPSALILFAVAMGLLHGGASSPLLQGAVQGLAAAALAVVAHATWGMAHTLCPDRRRQTLMLVCAMALLIAPPVVWAGMGVIAFGAFAGLWLGNQELRIRHFHKVLDDYINGPGGTTPGPA
jgi:chromate transporter